MITVGKCRYIHTYTPCIHLKDHRWRGIAQNVATAIWRSGGKYYWFATAYFEIDMWCVCPENEKLLMSNSGEIVRKWYEPEFLHILWRTSLISAMTDTALNGFDIGPITEFFCCCNIEMFGKRLVVRFTKVVRVMICVELCYVALKMFQQLEQLMWHCSIGLNKNR